MVEEGWCQQRLLAAKFLTAEVSTSRGCYQQRFLPAEVSTSRGFYQQSCYLVQVDGVPELEPGQVALRGAGGQQPPHSWGLGRLEGVVKMQKHENHAFGVYIL